MKKRASGTIKVPKAAGSSKSAVAVKPSLRKVISKMVKAVKDTAMRKRPAVRKGMIADPKITVQQEKESVEATKFTTVQEVMPQSVSAEMEHYNLPVRYADDKLVLLSRDPWWLYTYWDISENRINEVISSIPVYERQDLKWILRVYDVTCVADFNGGNANSFFDLDIRYEAHNWYINVNQPERDWCVEIGLRNPAGKFFAVARSNVIKTPYFGISSVIDEEWAIADEDFYRVLGMFDIARMGRTSMERKEIVEEYLQKQISSPLGSWGLSSASGQRPRKEQDTFFLEVWTELILYGRTEADAYLTVEGKPVKLRPDGTFSLRYALPVGDYQYEVKAVSKNQKHRRKKTPAVKRFDKQ